MKQFAVFDVDYRGDRSLTLRHIPYDRKPLSDDTEIIMKYLHKLWGFTVKLETLQSDGKIELLYQYGQEARDKKLKTRN